MRVGPTVQRIKSLDRLLSGIVVLVSSSAVTNCAVTTSQQDASSEAASSVDGSSTNTMDSIVVPPTDARRDVMLREAEQGTIPCNGQPCDGWCGLQRGGADTGIFTPPIPAAEAGSDYLCVPAPPLDCNLALCTAYSCSNAPECSDWLSRHCTSQVLMREAPRYFVCSGPGRATQGLFAEVATESLGEYLSSMALLEHHSVEAFRRLARELVSFNAPESFASRAEWSALEEVQHAQSVAALAQRFGTSTTLPPLPHLPSRSLEEVAIENAREGCVRETFGALLAHWQSTHATDATVATKLQTIAEEETRHAQLSWELHQWALTQLSPEAAARVEETLEKAVIELHQESALPFAPRERQWLGLPTDTEQQALLAALKQHLWS